MENRSTQLLKGTLNMCLLALLARQPCNGYEMVQQLAQQQISDLVNACRGYWELRGIPQDRR